MPNHDDALHRLAPDRLKPWARNARTHSKKQVRQIAESIRTFGFTNPVLIDDEDMILAGHGRVEAAKRSWLAAWPLPIERPCRRLAQNRLGRSEWFSRQTAGMIPTPPLRQDFRWRH